MAGTVLAATHWNTNSDLMLACRQLGYLNEGELILDPTYGKGLWWKNWRPDSLVVHDLKVDGVDFRCLPHLDDEFDVVTYDPPYVSKGGRKTSGMVDMDVRYGMDTAPSSPEELQELINAGLTEAVRVSSMQLVKCQDYISSGHLWEGTYKTRKHAESLGLTIVDRLEHISKAPRPQPPGRRQVHARRNLSTLFVFRK